VNNDLATAQRQLAKRNAELRWLNEQKNELLGMAAHDLRNPLAAVIAYSEFILEEEVNLSTEQSNMLRRIQVNGEAMLGIVEDVLDFSAIESGTVRLDPVEVALGDLLNDVVESSGLIADKKNIRIVLAVDRDLPPVLADRRKLIQVIDNLISNAIKFSHPGSSVTVAAGSEPGSGVWISVTDRGLGMSPEQLERLFKPFGRVGVQATGGEKSTGLGLAIARRIIEAHRGRIEVESLAGEGTTFTVVMPRGE
ncbi:MAG TPA: HAMP domain-containing sensor histidine kinase, partial [Thermoanaerobaculia bacterium]